MPNPFKHTLNYQTALASIRLLNEASILDLTPDDYDFLTSQGAYEDKLWLPVDRNRAARCVEAAVYGALDMLGYPRFPAPVEFVAAAIAVYVHSVNVQIACAILDGIKYSDDVIHGIDNPIRASVLFSHVLRILGGDNTAIVVREKIVDSNPLTAKEGVSGARKDT